MIGRFTLDQNRNNTNDEAGRSGGYNYIQNTANSCGSFTSVNTFRVRVAPVYCTEAESREVDVNRYTDGRDGTAGTACNPQPYYHIKTANRAGGSGAGIYDITVAGVPSGWLWGALNPTDDVNIGHDQYYDVQFWARPDVTCDISGPSSAIVGVPTGYFTGCSGGTPLTYWRQAPAGAWNPFSGSITFPAAGTYHVVVNGSTGSIPCSGNPDSWFNGGTADSPGWISCGPLGWLTVTVSAVPTPTPPLVAPSTPNLSGSPNCLNSPPQVFLEWTPSSPVTEYHVEECTDSTCAVAALLAPTTNTYFLDTSGVASGGTYYYRVRAHDHSSGLFSSYSNTVTVAVNCASLALTASSGCSPTRVDLSWSVPPGYAGFTETHIERCTGSGCTPVYPPDLATTTLSTYTDSAVSSGTTYGYRVRKHDHPTNAVSPYSNTAYTTPVCIAPTCSVTTSPAVHNLVTGQSGSVTANVTVSGAASVTTVNFGSYNTGIATVSPTGDALSPYATTVTGIAPGNTAVWATAFLSSGGSCTTPGNLDTDVSVVAPTPTPVPAGCSISTSPPLYSLVTGQSGLVTANVTISGSATISQVNFGSYNTSLATVTPNTDTASPYATNVLALAPGATAVWATAFLSNGNSCSTPGANDTDVNIVSPSPTPTGVPPTPTPIPDSCTVTTTPAVRSLVVGQSGSVTANVTVSGAASVTTVSFGSYNTGIATVSPTGDALSPYATTVTGIAPGNTAVWATAFLSNGNSCSTPGNLDTDINVIAPTPTPTLVPPGCSSTTTTPSGITQVRLGDPPVTITANVVPNAGSTVVSVDWLLTGSSVSIAPTQDTTSPYQTQVTGVSVGNSWLAAQARVTNGVTTTTCGASTSLVIDSNPPLITWFGGRGGDIIAAAGFLGTSKPYGAPLPYFVADSSATLGARPGLGYGVKGVDWARDLDETWANSRSWLVDIGPSGWSTLLSRSDNTYYYMRERLTAAASAPVTVTASVLDQSGLTALVDSAPESAKLTGGIVLLLRLGPVTLSGDINLGQRQAILLVEGGQVTLRGRVTFDDPGGLFMLLADQSSPMVVDPGVGEANPAADISLVGYPAHLEGIYYTQGIFDTGSGTRKLKVAGTVVGMSGVRLGRTYASEFDPAEWFEFRPDLIVKIRSIGLRKKIRRELLAP